MKFIRETSLEVLIQKTLVPRGNMNWTEVI